MEGELAVLREDLSQPQHYHAVTEFLERRKRLREAFSNAALALKTFPKDWMLEEDMLRCYARDGWVDEAYALRREQLERDASLERYKKAHAAGIAAKMKPDTLDAALFAILEQHEKSVRDGVRSGRWPSTARDTGAQDVTVRAQVLIWQERLPDALVLVQPPAVCSVDVLHDLAHRLDDKQADEAIRLLRRVFDLVMPRAGTPYTQEVKLVKEIARRMQPERRATWLDTIRAQYKAKRNFIRDLNAI